MAGAWVTARLACAALSVLLCAASFGAIVPLLPEAQIDFFRRHTDCLSSPAGDTACSSRASAANGYSRSIGALGTLLLSPYYGSYSDRHGRKLVFSLGLLAQALPTFALAAWPDDLGVFFLLTALVGFFPEPRGIFFTVLADVVPRERRVQSFGLGASVMLGAFATGSALSALLLPTLGSEALRTMAACLCSASAAAAAVAVPETLKSEEKGGEPSTQAEMRSRSLVRIIARPAGTGGERLLQSIATIGLFSLLPEIGTASIGLFYAKSRLQLTGQETSVYSARMLCVVGLSGFLWQSLGLGLLNRLCPSDLWVFQVASFFNFLHLLGFLVLWAPWVLLANASLAGGPLAIPTILRGLVSQALPGSVQGHASGVLSGVEAAVDVVGPVLFSTLFLAGGQVGAPWLPFIVGIAMAAAGSCLASLALPELQHQPACGKPLLES